MSVQDLPRQTELNVKLRCDTRLDEDFDPHSPHPDTPRNARKDEEASATQASPDTATQGPDSEVDIPLLPLSRLPTPALPSEADNSTRIAVKAPMLEPVVNHASVEIEKSSISNEDQDRTIVTTSPPSMTPSMTPSIPPYSAPSSISTTDVNLHETESPTESPSDETECNVCEACVESAQAEVIRPHAPFRPTVRSSLDTPPRLVRVPVMNQYVESEASIAMRDRGVEYPSDKQLRQPATSQLQGRELSIPVDIYPPPNVALPRYSMNTRPQAYALVDNNVEPGNGTGPILLVVGDETLAETTSATPVRSFVGPTSLGNNPYLPWSMSSMGSGNYPSNPSPFCSTPCQGGTSSNAGSPPPPTPINSTLPRHGRPLGEELPGTCLHCCLASSLCLDSLFRCFMKNCCCCCSGLTSHRRTTDDDDSFYG